MSLKSFAKWVEEKDGRETVIEKYNERLDDPTMSLEQFTEILVEVISLDLGSDDTQTIRKNIESVLVLIRANENNNQIESTAVVSSLKEFLNCINPASGCTFNRYQQAVNFLKCFQGYCYHNDELIPLSIPFDTKFMKNLGIMMASCHLIPNY